MALTEQDIKAIHAVVEQDAEAVKPALEALEVECAALCREYDWLSPAGTPNYRLVQSHPSTFRPRADLMLLGIHPRGSAAFADEPPGESDRQELACEIAALFGNDPSEVMRHTPSGNMIPFRTESISRLPDPLRKQGLAIGGRLVALVRPRILVLMGGDRVLFASAVSGLPGSVVDSAEETFGATRRAYRDVTVADDEASTFAAVLPLHALEDGLRTLRRRLHERQQTRSNARAAGWSRASG